MYCRKCGKEIPENSSFCQFCGENLGMAPRPSYFGGNQAGDFFRELTSFKNITSFHWASVICSVVMLILMFTKWFEVSIPYYGTGRYTLVGLFELCGRVEDLASMVSADDAAGVVTLFTFFVAGVYAIIFIVTAVHLYKTVRADLNVYYGAYVPEHISEGYSVMVTVAVTVAVCAVMILIFSAGIEPLSLSLTGSPYIVGGLALLNRFLILPKYQDAYYRRDEMLKKDRGRTAEEERMEAEAEREADMLRDGGWRCEICGKVNPQYSGTCGCGGHKPGIKTLY